MKIIQLVPVEDKEKLRKYFFDYLEELSQFDPTILMDENGTPIYNWYDCYWQEEGRYPFLFNIDNQFAGLAFVRELAPKYYEIAEFYVVPESRKDNNAIDFATQIIEYFDGRFEFSTRLNNLRAVKFWDRFTSRFSHVVVSVQDDYKKWIIDVDNLIDFN